MVPKKYPYPPQVGLLVNPGGISKTNILKEKYEQKLKCPRGWGSNQKPSTGRIRILSGTTQSESGLNTKFKEFRQPYLHSDFRINEIVIRTENDVSFLH